MPRSRKMNRHAAKKRARKSKAKVRQASVRSAVHGGSYRTINAPKGW